MTDDELKYWAFLSYSQSDNLGQRSDTQEVSRCWADWLHEALKTFSVPAEFVGHLNARGEMTPERIHPIFQDTHEQPGDSGLDAETRQALEQSRCLVVICSPRSAASLHVNETVRYFKQLGRGKNIFPIVIAGEPNAGEGHQPGGSPAAECFVPALRHPLRPDGTLDTARRPSKYMLVDARHGADKREILADDHRNAEADLEIAKIQLIAVLAGVAFNGLWWREQKRHFVDLADARHQAREALQQAGEARQQLQDARRQIREAQNQVLEIQNLPRDVHNQIQEAQIKALAAQDQAREAQNQLQEFQTKARETQSQLDEARSRVLAVENKFVEAQRQAEEARQQAEAAQRQSHEAMNRPPVEVRLEAAPDEIQEARRQIQELQSQAEQARAEAQAARDQAGEAQRQLQEARNQPPAPVATDENSEVRRQIKEARRQIQELQSQTQLAQAQIQEARSQIEAAQNQIQEAQRQAEEARRQTREIQAQAQKSETHVQQAREQADKTGDKIQAAENQLRQARRLTKVLALVTVIALLIASIVWWQRKVTGQAVAKSATDEPGKSDLNPVTLDQEQIRQALQQLSTVPPGSNRLQNLDALAARISPAEAYETLQISSTNLDDQSRRHFQLAVLGQNLPTLVADNPTNTLALLNDLKPVPGIGMYAVVFRHWATNNPVQAIEQRQSIPDHDADDRILCTIVATWVNQQPDAALNWVTNQPDSESKNKTLETCVTELAKTDGPKALALANSLPEGTWRNTMMVDLFNEWAAHDLAAAATACQQLPDGTIKAKAWEAVLRQQIVIDPAGAAADVTNLPAGDFRQNAIEQLASHWADTNTPAALTWAQSLSSSTESTAAVNQVVINWAQKDPSAATQFAGQYPGLSGDTLGGIAGAWAKNDLSATTNWVASLPDSEKKDTALLAMSETWSQTDAKGMVTYALALPPGDVQTQYLTIACHQLAIHNLPATLELLKSLPDDGLRQNLLEQAGRDCALPHIDQAAKYIAALPPGDDQEAAINGLLTAWTPADPEAALNWLCAFPENDPQTDSVQSVIKDWAQTAPAAAAKWLANLPAGTASDAMNDAFLEGAVGKYPDFVGQWAKSLTNDATRQKYQVRVAREWMKTDPTAATNWLNSLNLPEELKQLK